MEYATLHLKKNSDRRLRSGHLWIYSNEIDVQKSPPKSFEPGQQVEVLSAQDKWIGYAYINPNSLIAARIVSRDRKYPLTESLMVHRLKIAQSLRQQFYQQPFYRAAFGDSDGLPGLIVDRFDSTFVVQLTTAGMDRRRDEVVAALTKVYRPDSILFSNELASRVSEGLQKERSWLNDISPPVEIRERESRFLVDFEHGQKTGWFYDQAFNRDRLLNYVKGKRVLDVCCYSGSWGIRAAMMGASSVTFVDSSASALDMVEANAALNNISDRVDLMCGDAFDALKQLRAEREKYDVVLLDPPAFIKKRKDYKAGSDAYRRLNQLAIPLVNIGGFLISSSCSFHMPEAELQGLIAQAARHTDRNLQLLERGMQAPDHPVHPVISETAYLKTLYFRVLNP